MPKFVTNKPVLLAIIVFGVLGIYGASIWLAQLTPEKVLTNLLDMNAPTRYVFVADSAQPRIAVVDLLIQQQTNIINTQTTADLLALNPYNAQLAYASLGGQSVYFYDISTHAESKLAIDFPLNDVLFIPKSLNIVLVGERQFSVINTNDLSQQKNYDEFGGINSVHNSPLSDELWFIDTVRPSVLRYSFSKQTLTKFALPIEWQRFSASALSPDGEYLFFGVQDKENEWQAVIWQTSTQKKIAAYPMTAPLLQPYIDSNSQHFIAIDTSGQGIHIAIDDVEKPIGWQTMEQANLSALGWMDSKLLVGGEQEIALYRLNDMTSEQSLSIPQRIIDLFVTADSKTALFLQADLPLLYTFDFNKGTINSIELVDIKRPHKLIMGAGHTVCH